MTMNESVETIAAAMAPMKPLPRARRKAMKLRPVATGWRTITRVSAFEVFSWASLKSVSWMAAISLRGL